MSSTKTGGGTPKKEEGNVKDEEVCFMEEVLLSHNKFRASHGVPALKLSSPMCKESFNWAKEMAEKEVVGYRENNPHGQNVFYSWSSNPADKVSGQFCVRSWYEGHRLYEGQYGREPSMELIPKVGHFTQVVWKDCKEIGVGRVQSKEGAWYVVVDYSPKGNFVGEFAANVLPPQVAMDKPGPDPPFSPKGSRHIIMTIPPAPTWSEAKDAKIPVVVTGKKSVDDTAAGKKGADGSGAKSSSGGFWNNLIKSRKSSEPKVDAKKGDAKKSSEKVDAKKGDAKKSSEKLDAKKGDVKKSSEKLDAKKGDAKKSSEKLDAKKGDAKKSSEKMDAKKGDVKKSSEKLDAKNTKSPFDSKKGAKKSSEQVGAKSTAVSLDNSTSEATSEFSSTTKTTTQKVEPTATSNPKSTASTLDTAAKKGSGVVVTPKTTTDSSGNTRRVSYSFPSQVQSRKSAEMTVNSGKGSAVVSTPDSGKKGTDVGGALKKGGVTSHSTSSSSSSGTKEGLIDNKTGKKGKS